VTDIIRLRIGKHDHATHETTREQLSREEPTEQVVPVNEYGPEVTRFHRRIFH
jgi:hypothetical protein